MEFIKEMYIDILRRFRDAIRRKCPEKRKNHELVSASQQCSSTPVGSGQAFFSKECDNTGATPILSWLGSIWFLPSSPTEISIKGTALFMMVLTSLRMRRKSWKGFQQNGLQECFQHLYNHWQSLIVAWGDYFEGNVAKMIVLCCISQKYSDSGNF